MDKLCMQERYLRATITTEQAHEAALLQIASFLTVRDRHAASLAAKDWNEIITNTGMDPLTIQNCIISDKSKPITVLKNPHRRITRVVFGSDIVYGTKWFNALKQIVKDVTCVKVPPNWTSPDVYYNFVRSVAAFPQLKRLEFNECEDSPFKIPVTVESIHVVRIRADNENLKLLMKFRDLPHVKSLTVEQIDMEPLEFMENAKHMLTISPELAKLYGIFWSHERTELIQTKIRPAVNFVKKPVLQLDDIEILSINHSLQLSTLELCMPLLEKCGNLRALSVENTFDASCLFVHDHFPLSCSIQVRIFKVDSRRQLCKECLKVLTENCHLLTELRFIDVKPKDILRILEPTPVNLEYMYLLTSEEILPWKEFPIMHGLRKVYIVAKQITNENFVDMSNQFPNVTDIRLCYHGDDVLQIEQILMCWPRVRRLVLFHLDFLSKKLPEETHEKVYSLLIKRKALRHITINYLPARSNRMWQVFSMLPALRRMNECTYKEFCELAAKGQLKYY